MKSIILMTGARLLLVLMLVFSIFMLLRGHNEPGGGFIGGLIGATAFIVQAVAAGAAEARRVLRVSPEALAMVGLGIALGAGLLAAPFLDPPFTGQWYWVGGDSYETAAFSLNTVLVFDVGVYLVVLGSVLSLALSLEDEV